VNPAACQESYHEKQYNAITVGRGTLRKQAIKGTEFCQIVEENTNKINACIITLLVTCFQ